MNLVRSWLMPSTPQACTHIGFVGTVVPESLFSGHVWTVLKNQFPDRVIFNGGQVTLEGAVAVVTSPLRAKLSLIVGIFIGIAALGAACFFIPISKPVWRHDSSNSDRSPVGNRFERTYEFSWIQLAKKLTMAAYGAVILGGFGFVAHRINAFSLQPGIYFLNPNR